MEQESQEREIEVAPGTRLGQFLKVAAVAGSGGEAKHLIEEGFVTVNGEVEERRGRQLSAGDRVDLEGLHFLVSMQQ